MPPTRRPRAHHKTTISVFPSVHATTTTTTTTAQSLTLTHTLMPAASGVWQMKTLEKYRGYGRNYRKLYSKEDQTCQCYYLLICWWTLQTAGERRQSVFPTTKPLDSFHLWPHYDTPTLASCCDLSYSSWYYLHALSPGWQPESLYYQRWTEDLSGGMYFHSGCSCGWLLVRYEMARVVQKLAPDCEPWRQWHRRHVGWSVVGEAQTAVT